jgi:hypothetical protein
MGNRLTTPGDAYKYVKGEPIKSPGGYDVKIDMPLDFAGVTDHSEYVGVIALANDPSSPVSKLPTAQPLIIKGNTPQDIAQVFVSAIAAERSQAGQGADEPRNRALGLGEDRRIRRSGQRAGQVQRLLQLRVDIHAEPHEPPPQYLLQGLQAHPAGTIQLARFAGSTELWKWMDGQRKAGNDLRPAGDLAQRQSFRRAHVSDRSRSQRAIDRPGLRRRPDAQGAADRNQADQGTVGDPSRALAQ